MNRRGVIYHAQGAMNCAPTRDVTEFYAVPACAGAEAAGSRTEPPIPLDFPRPRNTTEGRWVRPARCLLLLMWRRHGPGPGGAVAVFACPPSRRRAGHRGGISPRDFERDRRGRVRRRTD